MNKGQITILSILMLFLVLMCGCGGKQEEGLTVYVVQTDALYKSAVEAYRKDYPEEEVQVVEFDTYEKMQELLSTELMSGDGPDVLLFNSLYSSEDPYKLFDSGALLTLDEQVQELSLDDYYSQFLEAGKMNGHQYYVPFSWNILQAYSTQALIEEKGYEDLYSAIPAEAEALSSDENVCMSNFGVGRADAVNYFMEIAGNTLLDMESRTLVDHKEEMQKTAEYVKIFYDNFEKMAAISERYRNDFAGAVSHFSYLLEDYSFMNNLRYYQSVYPVFVNEEMYFSPFAARTGGMTAQVIQYGAVSAHTENEAGAWKLLKYICDKQVSMDFSKYEEQNVYYAPVNRKVYEECVAELSSTYAPGPGKQVSPLEQEYAQVLREMPSKITKAVIPSSSYGMLIQECIEPYLLDEDSFDNCYDKLLQRLELYLNE